MAWTSRDGGVVIYDGTGTAMARIAGLSAEMDEGAEKVIAVAKSMALQHRKTGSYMNHFGTDRIPGKKGVIDREAYNDHRGAAAIEDGHLQPFKGPDGESLVKWIPGQFIMRKALAAVPGVR